MRYEGQIWYTYTTNVRKSGRQQNVVCAILRILDVAYIYTKKKRKRICVITHRNE